MRTAACLLWVVAAAASLLAVSPPLPKVHVGPRLAVSMAVRDAGNLLAASDPHFATLWAESKGEITDAILDYLHKTAEGRKHTDHESIRYLWVDDLPDEQEYQNFLAALQLRVNFSSKNSRMIRLHTVNRHLVRIDTSLPRWNPALFEAALAIEPYFHKREELEKDSEFVRYFPGGTFTSGKKKGKAFERQVFTEKKKTGDIVDLDAPWLDKKEILALKAMLFTEVPIVEAGWFFVQSCKQVSERNNANTGFGYYDFFGLNDRDDFFKLVGYDKERFKQFPANIRGVQLFSKVSGAPRILDRDRSINGPLWVALDVVDPTGRGNPLAALKRGAFNHKIEEWYGVLFNELDVHFLSNNEGVRANNAPADLAGFGDKSPLNEGNDSRIHVHLACVRCHAGSVLRPIRDSMRLDYRTIDRLPGKHGGKLIQGKESLGDIDKKQADELDRQYFGPFQKFIDRDIDVYRAAYTEATRTHYYPLGLAPQRAVEAYCRTFHRYATDPVDLKRSARMLGVDATWWKQRLDYQLYEVKVLDPRLKPLQGGGVITSQMWEDVYELAAEMSAGYIPRLRRPLP